MFLKSYKDNCTTLILRNKASALKLNFKSILNTYRAGKMSNRNFVEIFFTEQAKNICLQKKYLQKKKRFLLVLEQ